MKNGNRKTEIGKRLSCCRAALFCVLSLMFFAYEAFAQSTDQNYPTPISTNEIVGKIAARDLGDARLTTYFYFFNGAQGDVFINVKTGNFDGDIDVFASENLRPLTKITVYSDAPQTETGRVIYLRKPEKLILRVQGRTPNDAAATFDLKFAGSFAPAAETTENAAPQLPEIKTENQGDVIVNSVGTIIGIKPKPTPAPAKETIAENQPPKTKPKADAKKAGNKQTENKEIENSETNNEANAENAENSPPAVPEKIPQKPVVVTENTATESTSAETASAAPTATKMKPARTPPARRSAKSSRAKNDGKNDAASEAKKKVEPNPLENVRLVVLFKDGTKIERPMSEVLRVGVDKGVLTLITKDGKITRYSILDVAKMTIE